MSHRLSPDEEDAREDLADAIAAEAVTLAEAELHVVGAADEVLYAPGVAEGLREQYAQAFDPLPWLEPDGDNEPMPRDDCPGDVLQMFVWTGTERQVLRAVYLLRALAVSLLAASADVMAAAETNVTLGPDA